MASKSEIVRITYKELESSVQDKDKSNKYSGKSNNDGKYIYGMIYIYNLLKAQAQ